jgi:hypothetical protein
MREGRPQDFSPFIEAKTMLNKQLTKKLYKINKILIQQKGVVG